MREGLRWPRLRHALCCRNAGGAPVTSSGGSGWRAGNRAAGGGGMLGDAAVCMRIAVARGGPVTSNSGRM